MLLYNWPGPAPKVQDLTTAQLCRTLAVQLGSILSPAQGTTAAGGRWVARNRVAMFLVTISWLNISVRACDERLAFSEWLPLVYSGCTVHRRKKQPMVMA